jgi:nucleoside-diphosphate-sugar epimerase
MHILIIGGTRNVGHLLALSLHQSGHQVSILNRGITRDELPDTIERLRADRTDSAAMARVLGQRHFDAVVDTSLYNADEATAIVNLFAGKTAHYIFLSSGQVYLVREAIERPFIESAYAGRLMPAPKPDTFAYEEWLYGMNKRHAEDVLMGAWLAQQFPVSILRLPMIIGERDHHHRLYNYILRLRDGGPILVPTTPTFALRHVYSGDVVQAIERLLHSGTGKGSAYNISQDEAVTLDEFLGMVGEMMGVKPQILRLSRELLAANGFLPDCSPFSERWMSELENTQSKTELGMRYTPLKVYLAQTVQHYQTHDIPKPAGYRRRRAEIKFAENLETLPQ